MSSDLALHVQSLGKQYRIGAARPQYGTLRDRIVGAASGLASRLAGQTAIDGPTSTIWALKDVSFDIMRGEVVGIVGGNGAGKSTLLKVLSRITEPTEGSAVVYGRVGSLLEVGTGFHPELTGRENIFLNGAILGMPRAEVARKFDDIVDFSGVSAFIDTPVRFYSSGMYVRLAFAVAAHMEPDILVIDEVLAVGDAEFQRRCLGKMGEVSRGGRTVLFVSHNLEAVQRLCTRGLLLRQGRIELDGSIAEAVTRYRAHSDAGEGVGVFNTASRRGLGWARFTDVRVVDDAGRSVRRMACDRDLIIEMTLATTDPASRESLRGLMLHLVVCSDEGLPLVSLTNIDDPGVELPATDACTMRMRLQGPTFVPGRYRLNVFLGVPYVQHVDEIPDALEFEIAPPERPWRPYELSPASGHVCRTAVWECAPEAAPARPGSFT
jgi:lipopolysaccharide transport system ATP-binding protein